jgi:competence protein ComEC
VEAAGEAALPAVEATVLKVAHHGSRSSSSHSFLQRVRAPFAVISVGHRNRFGHPHPDVLAALARARAQVLRTDVDGAVTFSTDGSRLWVRTERTRLDQRLR